MLGVLDPGEGPSTSEQNDALIVANQMLSSWYNEQLLALEVLVASQNKQGLSFVANQVEKTNPLVQSYTLAGATYTAPTFTAATISGTGVPNFPDLTTVETFPQGYDLAIVLNLAVLLKPQYPGVTNAPPDLEQRAAEALQAAVVPPGKLPAPGMAEGPPA